MKKVFAALAASAVAVSMLAFTGCGDSKTDEGAIKGDYQDKTPEQVTEIVDKIDTDKLFGDPTDSETAETFNMGFKTNLEGGFTMGEMMTVSGSVNFDYKMTSSEENAAGAGSMSVKANYMSMITGSKQEDSIDFSGNVYNNTEWVYAASGDQKLKINMLRLGDAIGGDSDDVVTPTAYYANEEDGMSLSAMLAMAQQFGVKVAIDDTDGIKLKLSVTEESLWKIVAAAGAEEGVTEEKITEMKGLITFNTFKFDLYFAIDKDGKFSGASVVMDIDVTADASIIADMFQAEGNAEAPAITAKLKGSVELYTHNDTVTVPDTVKGDDYADMTDTVIAMIGNMM